MAESTPLARRERQIVEALYHLNEASVAEVLETISNPPSYSAVRAMLNLLVGKKVVKYRREGKRYLYRAIKPKGTAQRTALRELVRNYYGGHPTAAIKALLRGAAGELTRDEFRELKQLIKPRETHKRR